MNTLTKILTLFTALLCLTLTSEAQQRSMEDVISIIENSAPQLLGNSQNAFKSKSFGQKQSLVVASSQAKGLESLYANGQSEAFYIYNAQGGGFMLISADERMQPILGYADSGTFDTDSLPPNLKAWLQNYVDEANALTSTSTTATSSARSKTFGAKSTTVGPLVAAQWGQSYPYNMKCPTLSTGLRAVTGCVATAMAQIMYKYKKPTTGIGSNSYTTATNNIAMSLDFTSVTFDWDKMKDTYSYTEDDETEDAIAELMLACGVAVNMDYNTASGSTIRYMMNGLLNHFGYDKDMAIASKDYMQLDDWHTTLIKQLDNGCPLPVSATTAEGAGHAFVIDGYKFDDAEYPYYHINWGWNGSENGYFLMSNMATWDYTFSKNISVIINVKPDDGTQDLPTYMQAVEITPSSQSVDLTKNQKLTIDVNTLINQSCQNFSGNIVFCLEDAQGTDYDLYTMSVSDLEPFNYYNSNNVQCKIPSSITTGDYYLKAYSIPTGSTTRYPVTMGNDPGTISITNAENVYFPTVMAQKVDATIDANNFSITASGIMNGDMDTSFKGSLQMAVADYTDDFVTIFGNNNALSKTLNYLSYTTTEYTFSGTLPTTVGNGAYKLYLGANQTGYSYWGYVQKYTVTDGYIKDFGKEASTKFWVKEDGSVTLTAPYTVGDVNHDGYINIADLDRLNKLNTMGYTTKDLTYWTADLNEDGKLSDEDITALMTSVKDNTTFKSNSGAANLVSAGVIEHGNSPYLIICLNNATDQYHALQLDLTLPTGLAVSDGAAVSFSSRAEDYTGTISNNRLLIYSTSVSSFSGAEGAIACIPLSYTSSPAAGSITLSNIVLSGNEGSNAVSASDVTVAVSEDLPNLADAIAKAETYPLGDKLGQYTANDGFADALAAAQALGSSATVFDEFAAIPTIATDGLVFNTPAKGQLIHIKDNNGKYMTCRNNTTSNRIEFTDTKDEATIFCYYDGNRLVAYKTGCFVSNDGTYPTNTTEVTADNASLNYSIIPSTATIGKYLIAFGDGTHYMSAGGDAKTFSSASEITDTDYDFTLEEADGVKVTISSQGMSTFYSPVALEIPTGVKVYTGEYDSVNNTIKLTALRDIIPANTGVLLEGTADTEVTFATASAADETTTSCLSGNVPSAATLTSTNVYTLQVVSGTLGFYRYTGESLNGFKAYFATNSSSPGFAIIKDGDEAEGIHAASTASDGTSTIFDLSGNAVTTPLKGQIYIIDGKKVKK